MKDDRVSKAILISRIVFIIALTVSVASLILTVMLENGGSI